MSQHDDNFHIGHRERLKEKFLNNMLTEYEKLELLLSFAIPRRDIRPLSRKLIQHFGNVYYVIIAEYKDLIAVPGIGRSSAILIKLVCDLMKISYVKKLSESSLYMDQKSLEAYCRVQLAGKHNEEVHVLYLDAQFKLFEHEVHSKGNIESSNIYPERILEKCIFNKIKYVVLLHNHPASDNSFSSQDVSITQDLSKLLKVCNISLYDHYVIAGGILHSMREQALLNVSEFFNTAQ